MDRLRGLLPFLRPYRYRLFLALAGTCLFTLFSLAPPLLIRYLIDHIAGAEAWDLLFWWALAFCLVPVVGHFLRFINVSSLMWASQRMVADIRLAMYRKILWLEMRYHGETSSGALVSRLMDDVNMLHQILTENTVQLLVDLIVFVFSLSVAFSISVKLSCILCGILVLYVGVYRIFSSRIRAASTQYRGIYDRIAGRLQETVAGVRQVRIYNAQERETETFLDSTSRSLEKSLTSNMSSVGLSTWCSGIAGFGSTLCFGLAAYYVLQGEISKGDLIAFDRYLWMAINPAIRLTTIAGQLTETFVSLDRINEVLREPYQIVSEPDAPRFRRGQGEVEFREVDFAYVPDVPLYRGLNLTVDGGSTVALVGHTGCGKTTLTSLLMRQWDVQGGGVFIDGQDIRAVDLKSLRAIFGVVLQDPVIFEGTLAENIAYGAPHATREEITRASRAAEIHEMAMDLPDGYDTVLGTQGVQLSKGEKQRISIARAILRDPLILVMDEATSALDSESEALIQKALERVLKGRTSFVVAHRLSTITGADKIVVMDAGAVVEMGTHAELMRLENGQYRRLYEELQRGGGAEDE